MLIKQLYMNTYFLLLVKHFAKDGMEQRIRLDIVPNLPKLIV